MAGARGGLTSKLVHQHLVDGAGDECPDDIGVGDVGELGALLGETPHEVSERLIMLLPATPKVTGVPRAHVCALKVPDKDLDHVSPAMDQTLREVLKPRLGRLG